MNVVINTCVGSFGLSNVAVDRLIELGSLEDFSYYRRFPEDNHYTAYENARHDSLLLQVIKELGVLADISDYALLFLWFMAAINMTTAFAVSTPVRKTKTKNDVYFEAMQLEREDNRGQR